MIDRWIVDNPPSQKYPIYTRGNVGEVFPEPVTPLTCTMGIVPYADPGWRDAFERFGAFTHDEFDPGNIEIIGVFGGYCYLNVSVSRILGVRTPGLTPEAIDYQLWGEMPGVPPYVAHDGDEDAARTAAIQQTLGWALTADDLPEQRDEEQKLAAARLERPDLTALSNAELVDRYRTLFDADFRRLFAQHIFVTYCATVPMGIVQQVCTQIERPDLMMRVIAGVGDVESAAPSMTMWRLGRIASGSRSLTTAFEEGIEGSASRIQKLAELGDDDAIEFQAAFEDFLLRYGCRGPNEWETRSQTWETHPDLALAAVDRMRLADDDADPALHQVGLAHGREKHGADVLEMLKGNDEAYQQFGAALNAAVVFMAGRERSKTNAIKLVHEGRVLMHELGRRMVDAGHFDTVGTYGMLRAEELDQFVADPGSLADELRRREADYQSLYEVEPPFVFDGAPPPISSWARRAEQRTDVCVAGDVLAGIPGCPGSARGRARIVLSPYDPGALEPGDVLVAPLTDPSWTPLFVAAGAVVVDVGAPLSHAIIVSRELGIPCAVSVTDATKRIPDGALVEVDGTTGTVTVLETA
jgi:pyruvate,water dikinase